MSKKMVEYLVRVYKSDFVDVKVKASNHNSALDKAVSITTRVFGFNAIDGAEVKRVGAEADHE